VARRTGRFEHADGGTLFLDEVGEIPLELQPKLLRVLQEREFERIGSARTITCDVRLVAATHRDLKQMLADRTFRQDLYYRLNVFPIVIPPLRDRREDIGPLVRHLVEHFSAKLHKEPVALSPRTLAQFESYSWPGNVRELQNVLERAIILADGPELDVTLPDEEKAGHCESAALDDVTRAHIEAVLAATNGVISGPSGAAAVLRVKRTTLHFRMKKLGIEHRQGESRRPTRARSSPAPRAPHTQT
jgi:formate hydrogenlyase transcriptional activator